jgi:hypothetical protein
MANTSGINLPGSGYSMGVGRITKALKAPAAPIHGKAAPARKTVLVNGGTSLIGKITTLKPPIIIASRGPSAPIVSTPLGTKRTSPVAAKAATPDAHQLHVQHAAAVAKKAANATKTVTRVAGASSTARSGSSTLDAHQLHVAHLAHIGAVAGAASSPINPPDPGGGVSPAQGAPGVADTSSTGGSLVSTAISWGLRIAVLLLLIWAWRKGYFKGITKAAGKAIKGTGKKVGGIL